MEALIDEPFYSFLFVGLGWVLLFLEIFVPSGGILGIGAFCCIGLGVYGFFHQGNAFLGVSTIIVSLAFGVMLLRLMLRRVRLVGGLDPTATTSVDSRISPQLVGKRGQSATPLRPAGVAVIDGRRVDVVAAGSFIAAQRPVEVTDTSGNRVVVREIKESEMRSETKEEVS